MAVGEMNGPLPVSRKVFETLKIDPQREQQDTNFCGTWAVF